MTYTTQSETVQRTISAIDRGDTLGGLIAFEALPELRGIPVVTSYLAYCMAKERGQIREAVELCQSALSAEPRNPAHYLNLGRVYMLTKQKTTALTTFRKGLSRQLATGMDGAAESSREGQSRQQALILEELRRLGIRRRVPFSSLDRNHPLNKLVGKLLWTITSR
jgi:tetratricopeptide (TPR) repeat protein